MTSGPIKRYQVRRLTETKVVAWRNGHGSTQVLLDQPSLRVSVASLHADAPFSNFGELHRFFLLLSGQVRLVIDGESVDMKPGGWVRFRGDCRVSSFVAQPSQALNIMSTAPLDLDVQRHRSLPLLGRAVVVEPATCFAAGDIIEGACPHPFVGVRLPDREE